MLQASVAGETEEHDEHFLPVPGWAPPGWRPTGNYVSMLGTEQFVWPTDRREYRSRSTAKKRADLLKSFGATVVIERSSRIQWPDPSSREPDQTDTGREPPGLYEHGFGSLRERLARHSPSVQAPRQPDHGLRALSHSRRLTGTSSKVSRGDRTHLDALVEFLSVERHIRFSEMNQFLSSRGVPLRGEEELTGEHVGLPHVDAGTTLFGPASSDYVRIVETLFKYWPVTLKIGDPAMFRTGEEPWWVTLDGGPVP